MRGVVVCAEPYGAEAGLWAFQQGGHAVDAAVAAAFSQGVTNPLGAGKGWQTLPCYWFFRWESAGQCCGVKYHQCHRS